MKSISEVNVLRLLLYNKRFREKVLTEIDRSYFDSSLVSEVFDIMKSYNDKHLKMPEDNIKLLIYNNDLKQDKDTIEQKINLVNIDMDHYRDMDSEILIPDVEKWIKHQRFSNHIADGFVQWQESEDKDEPIGFRDYYDDMKKIMEFTFDKELGTDLENYEMMFIEHKRKDKRIPFHNAELNRITKGGTTVGSLNVVCGPPHSGKSRFLSSIVIDYAKASPKNNILYITLEISENEMATNIDRALLDVSEEEMDKLTEEEFIRRKKIISSKYGNIKVKFFPTSSVNMSRIRSLISEYTEKGFAPNIIVIDHIGIMLSERAPRGAKSYEIGKYVSEEMRSFSSEQNITIWTGAQMNRAGASKNKDVAMEDIAESYAINATADIMIFIMKLEELDKQNKQLFKILKNRPGRDPNLCLMANVTKRVYNIDFISAHSDIETLLENQHIEMSDMNDVKNYESEIVDAVQNKPRLLVKFPIGG